MLFAGRFAAPEDAAKMGTTKRVGTWCYQPCMVIAGRSWQAALRRRCKRLPQVVMKPWPSFALCSLCISACTFGLWEDRMFCNHSIHWLHYRCACNQMLGMLGKPHQGSGQISSCANEAVAAPSQTMHEFWIMSILSVLPPIKLRELAAVLQLPASDVACLHHLQHLF